MYKQELSDKRTYKALFLLNLLSYKECSKTEIIQEFKKNNVEISKSSVINYIEKLKAHNIPIKTRRHKGVDLYYLNKDDLILNINELEANVTRDVKKLLMLEKDHENIQRAMKLFYKFALLAPSSQTRRELADFGYYSTINWELVEELKHHCKNKNIIQMDYLLTNGKFKSVTMHVDTIKISEFSQRMYLHGIFDFGYEFSRLPVDRIFIVRKVISEHERFDMETEVLTYKISKEASYNMEFDLCEAITGYEDDLAIVKRPIDDSFQLIQKLLYFCPDLYYISDPAIKKRVQEKLFILKDLYDDRPY